MKISGISQHGRKAFSCSAIVLAGLGLSGCLGAPTYGTGTPADEQLLNDVTSILSLAPKNEEPIEYNPRPDLVTPPSDDTLPQPQESVASASNPAWPESPEERRKRLRDEATARQDDPTYDPAIESDIKTAPPARPRFISQNGDPFDWNYTPPATQRAEFNKRLAQSRQGSPTQRRYLSEPPLEYRQPAETAATDDVGEDEWKKAARRKREARKKAGKSSWADILPDL